MVAPRRVAPWPEAVESAGFVTGFDSRTIDFVCYNLIDLNLAGRRRQTR